MSARLKWPMQLENGHLAEVEQDSDADIVQCAMAILKHRPGDRTDIPEMGVSDPAFAEQPLETDVMQEVLRRHEPRVDLLASAAQVVEDLVAEIAVTWSRKES